MKTNNSVTNLEWVTAEENSRHASLAGHYSGSRKKLSEDDKRAMLIDLEAGMGPTAIAAKYDISVSLVDKIKLRIKTTGLK